MERIALVMAGGSGERFWPLSRPDQPKQLLSLTGTGKVMLEETVIRIEEVYSLENIFVVTSPELNDLVREQLPWLGSQVFAEPQRRNSSGAIIWGMGLIAGLLGVVDISFTILPSDHQVSPVRSYRAALNEGIEIAETTGRLVTIGIQPDRPETGYGYIECGNPLRENTFEVARFVEKPAKEVAVELLKHKGMLWNSGIFIWRYDAFLDQLKKVSPIHAEVLLRIQESVFEGNTKDAKAAFARLPDISIDHALMERTQAAVVLQAGFKWDDLGAWDSLSRVLPQDRAGNVSIGRTQTVDSRNCVLYNSTSDQSLNVLGLEDIIVVATEDAILVCPKDRAQDVKKLSR